GGSLAGIIIALLVVFEELGKKLDFSTMMPGGEPHSYDRAIAAFTAMAAVLLYVALTGKRPVAGVPEDGEKARLGEIGADDAEAGRADEREQGLAVGRHTELEDAQIPPLHGPPPPPPRARPAPPL